MHGFDNFIYEAWDQSGMSNDTVSTDTIPKRFIVDNQILHWPKSRF